MKRFRPSIIALHRKIARNFLRNVMRAREGRYNWNQG